MKSLITKLTHRLKKPFSTIEYWEQRYRQNGTSGNGSYNHLAAYKAKFLNEFLSSYDIKTAIEFGCGDGNQLSLIQYPSYIGLDVSVTSIQICQQIFSEDLNKQFKLYNPYKYIVTENEPCVEIPVKLTT